MELIYLRKSQADNPDESIKSVLERHEYQLQEFAEKSLGYRIPESRIYREVISGETIEARAEIKKVLKQIESPDVTAVIVIEPQRLGRGDLEDCGRLVNAFRYTNTKIMTPVKTYNLQEKYDRKFFEMELQRGSDYLEYYKEIQARGRRLSVKRGCYIGSVAPFGYKRVCIRDEHNKKCWTLEADPTEAPAIQLAFDLFVNHGYGFANVAHALDESGYHPRKSRYWSPAAIKDMLENPVYIGKVRWDRRKTVKNITNGELRTSRPKSSTGDYQIYDGLHKGIIEEEIFKAALSRRGKGIRVKEKMQVINPLAGLLFCSCGRAMIYQPYTRREKSKPRLICSGHTHCENSSCTYEEIETQILNILKHIIHDFEMELKSFDTDQVEIISSTVQHLESTLAALEKKELNLWEKYSEENMPKEIFEKLIQKVNMEKEQTKQALAKAASQPVPDKAYYEQKIVTFQNALDAMWNDEIPPEEKNMFLKECISRIKYSREKAKRLSAGDTPEKLPVGDGWTKPKIHLEVHLNM